jgi:catechol 2,3-dioxygenase-like lactoylglutathione lyase family enzyme
MKIQITSVFVPDPSEALKFYTDTLGFQTRLHIPEAYVAIVASPEDPDGVGLLLEPNQNPIASTYQKALYEAELPVITFGTTDIQKDYEQLRKRGVIFRTQPTKTDYGMEAIFEDNCGNLIQLAELSFA